MARIHLNPVIGPPEHGDGTFPEPLILCYVYKRNPKNAQNSTSLTATLSSKKHGWHVHFFIAYDMLLAREGPEKRAFTPTNADRNVDPNRRSKSSWADAWINGNRPPSGQKIADDRPVSRSETGGGVSEFFLFCLYPPTGYRRNLKNAPIVPPNRIDTVVRREIARFIFFFFFWLLYATGARGTRKRRRSTLHGEAVGFLFGYWLTAFFSYLSTLAFSPIIASFHNNISSIVFSDYKKNPQSQVWYSESQINASH